MNGLRPALAMAGAFALIACSQPAPAEDQVAAAPVATSPTPAPPPAVATYPVSTDEALARWIAEAPQFAALERVELGGCQALKAPALGVRFCSAGGQLSSLIIVSDTRATNADLRLAVSAAAKAISPDVTAADLARVQRTAIEALAARRATTLCPMTRCLRFDASGDFWTISATPDL